MYATNIITSCALNSVKLGTAEGYDREGKVTKTATKKKHAHTHYTRVLTFK